MGWLIAYDISDVGRWRRVYRRVQADATRLQYSLFYAEFDRKEIDRLVTDLGHLIHHREDDVRFYLLPGDAWIRIRGRPIVPQGVNAGMLLPLLARNDPY